MSPMDDELRHTLHQKSATLAPPLDVFVGVEQRARRMRRRRVGASVAGAALAVAALAVGVPQLVPSHPHRGTIAAPVVPTPAAASYALDPASPWAYRGDPAVLASGNLEAFREVWAAKYPGSQLEPLFGQLDASSRVPELVFVGKGAANVRWGVVVATATGPTILEDNPLPANVRTLTTVLSGDGVDRLLIVAAPTIGSITYTAKDDTLQSTNRLADGVATIDLHAGDATGSVQAVAAGGKLVATSAVPSTAIAVPQPTPTPGNVLHWGTRSGSQESLLAEAQAAYLGSRTGTTLEPSIALLDGGTDAAGTQYLLAQAWQPGDSVADTVGFVRHPDGSTELQLLARATSDTKLLVLDVVDAPAGGTETLVVGPQPESGQLRYAADGVHFVAVPIAADGSLTIARDPKATNDRLELLNTDGSTLFVGSVFNLKCGLSGCG